MNLLVDGSNLLGTAGLDRTSDAAKRELLKMLAAYCRSTSSRAIVYFDGAAPRNFGGGVGSARVVFAFPSSADDLIARESGRQARSGRVTVVTSDRGLSDRVRARNVTLLRSDQLASALRDLEVEGSARAEAGDWESWFSDPENREQF